VIHAPVVGFAEGSSLMFVTAYLMMGGMFVVKHVLDSREAASAATGTVPEGRKYDERAYGRCHWRQQHYQRQRQPVD
jgi:hypothetical protein